MGIDAQLQDIPTGSKLQLIKVMKSSVTSIIDSSVVVEFNHGLGYKPVALCFFEYLGQTYPVPCTVLFDIDVPNITIEHVRVLYFATDSNKVYVTVRDYQGTTTFTGTLTVYIYRSTGGT